MSIAWLRGALQIPHEREVGSHQRGSSSARPGLPSIMIDASALIEVLRRSGGSEVIQDRIFDPRESLHAPHVIDLEVAQVLRRYVGRGDMAAERGSQALDDLTGFPITRYEHEPFLLRIWSLREKLTAYDAAYVALAEVLGATLVTRGGRLAKAAEEFVSVEVV